MIWIQKKRTQKGFTLIEILIALSILAIGLIGIFSLFPVGMDAQQKSEVYTLAANLASKWVSTYQALGWREGYSVSGGEEDWQTDDDYDGLEFKRIFSDGIDTTDSSDIIKIKVQYYNRGKATELYFGDYYIQSYD